MRLFLLFVAAILVPAALSYGINPAAVLLKSMSIAVEGTDQTEMLPAVMGPYLGMTIFLRHRPPSRPPGVMSQRSGLCFSIRSLQAASSA